MVMNIEKGGHLEIEAVVPGGTVPTQIEMAGLGEMGTEGIIDMDLDLLMIIADIEIEEGAMNTRAGGLEGVEKGPDLTVPVDPGPSHRICGVKAIGEKGTPIEQDGDLDLQAQDETM